VGKALKCGDGVQAKLGSATTAVSLCRGGVVRYVKARVVAEHLHRDASMISRLHAAYVENRDKRSESELQRLLKTKSTIHA
jgi:hypothetical protein